MFIAESKSEKSTDVSSEAVEVRMKCAVKFDEIRKYAIPFFLMGGGRY